jgi:hypothetical protein
MHGAIVKAVMSAQSLPKELPLIQPTSVGCC